MPSERLHERFLVLRMNALGPFIDTIGELMIGIADHALPARGEVGAIVLEIPFPQRIIDAADGPAVTFLEQLQTMLGLHSPYQLDLSARAQRFDSFTVARNLERHRLQRVAMRATLNAKA